MKTVCQLISNPARDIIEGRRKIPTVQTVPMVVGFTLQPAQDKRESLDSLSKNVVDLQKEKPQLDPCVNAFRSTSPGVFTTKTLVAFAKSFRYCTFNTRNSLHQKLNLLRSQGKVVRMGKENGQVSWAFI